MNYLTFRVRETDDGQYKATEPNTESELYGYGETPHDAIAHYCEITKPEGER